MAFVNGFATFLAAATTGVGSPTLYSNGNAYIGVGNGTTAFSAAHTDLQGASKARKAMDATYPQVSGAVMTFRCTFATGDANFTWEEWAIFNASSSGTMMNRVVANNGTKVNTESKQVTVGITISV